MSMYCRSLGFQVMDLSGPGQPFACAWRGLPYPPEILIQREHAVVHSLKGDIRATREELQSIFQEFGHGNRRDGALSALSADKCLNTGELQIQ